MDDTTFPIPSVRLLRQAVKSFGRCPPSQREDLVAHIKVRAEALHAADLPWVDNFLRAKGAK
jgi:hypothetical protein